MTTSSIQTEYESFYQGRPVCITGGAGFIGSTLCHRLHELGASVSVIDDLSSGREENLAGLDDRFRFVRGSILDPKALSQAMDGAEIVFHQAALTSVPRSVEEPDLYHKVNTTGTFCVLEASRKAGAKRVVYASSSSVYGEQVESPKVESMRPDPRSPYAAAKCAGECLLNAWAHSYGLSTISLRYFNIFGPRQRPDSPYAAVIPRFAEAMLGNMPITIYGDGTQTRDYTHVTNAIHANLLAGSSRRDLKGECFNIACGVSTDLLELITLMSHHYDVKPQIEYAPMRPGEVLHSLASIDHARELIGYEPLCSFELGLTDVLAYYQSGFTVARS
ncbi:MAG: NAD-dependent epimerase/dehydratase family protein [Planctomycetes bacterium]|nr:NAD-dependent epimerase/dehydratase family protein [Planctomycetota bacterium]